jgi:hypothetical protein
VPVGARARTEGETTAPWRERSEKAVLRAKEQRIRGLVAELYERTKDAADADYRGIVRRSLVECEHLLDLAADALRRDWLER